MQRRTAREPASRLQKTLQNEGWASASSLRSLALPPSLPPSPPTSGTRSSSASSASGAACRLSALSSETLGTSQVAKKPRPHMTAETTVGSR